MSDKYMKEIEEILRQAEDSLPKDRDRAPRGTPKTVGGPLGRVSGKIRITPGKLMLGSFALLLLALIMSLAGVGSVVHLVVAGLVLFVIAYALFFVRPGGSFSSYEKRWRGRPIEERLTVVDRLKRWLKS